MPPTPCTPAQADVEFVRAIEDHSVKDATLLSFRKGDVIRIVRSRNMHISKGNSLLLPKHMTSLFPDL